LGNLCSGLLPQWLPQLPLSAALPAVLPSDWQQQRLLLLVLLLLRTLSVPAAPAPRIPPRSNLHLLLALLHLLMLPAAWYGVQRALLLLPWALLWPLLGPAPPAAAWCDLRSGLLLQRLQLLPQLRLPLLPAAAVLPLHPQLTPAAAVPVPAL
jgi:hypothetical protein